MCVNACKCMCICIYMHVYVYGTHTYSHTHTNTQVLRESIANKSLGVTTSMLRGHEGPLIPAERLQGALRALTQPITETEGNMPPGNYIVFAARNKAASIPCSPRKRGPPEADPKGRGVSASRRSGASSASHLHRCVCMLVCVSARYLHRCVCMLVCVVCVCVCM